MNQKLEAIAKNGFEILNLHHKKKKHIEQEKKNYPFLKCQFTRKIPKQLAKLNKLSYWPKSSWNLGYAHTKR